LRAATLVAREVWGSHHRCSGLPTVGLRVPIQPRHIGNWTVTTAGFSTTGQATPTAALPEWIQNYCQWTVYRGGVCLYCVDYNNSISLIAMSITDYRRTTHDVANRPEGMGATRHCHGHNYCMLIIATYSYFPHCCKQVYKL
jgi:hypothetical protein